jgi:hypothetical protein
MRWLVEQRRMADKLPDAVKDSVMEIERRIADERDRKRSGREQA